MKLGQSWVLCLFVCASAASAQNDVTYSEDVKPILDNACVECHHTGGRSPDLSALPFVSARGEDEEAIVTRILNFVSETEPRMPPGRRTKLTATQVNMIRTWQEQGRQP